MARDGSLLGGDDSVQAVKAQRYFATLATGLTRRERLRGDLSGATADLGTPHIRVWPGVRAVVARVRGAI